MKALFRALCASLILLSIASCGGGGGSSFFGAANISLIARPGTIDTGDRVTVEVRLSDLNKNGIIVKVRFPDDLFYVIASSFLTVNGQDRDVDPAFNLTDSKGDTYLVYFVSEKLIGDGTGYLSFDLEASSTNKKANIEGDADVDDPNIANADEFDIEAPEFAAETEDSIEIVS